MGGYPSIARERDLGGFAGGDRFRYLTCSRTTTDDRGRVLPLTRAGIWVLLVLAALNGLFLYFVPAQAETHYAWSIKPSVNAAFIGAGFLAGTLATGLVLPSPPAGARSRTLPIALWVLATSLLAATLIHNDRFKFDYAPTWVWTIVYAAVPLAVPFLVARQRANADPEPAGEPRARARCGSSARCSASASSPARSPCSPRPSSSASTGCGRSRRCSPAPSPPGTRCSGRC